MEEVFMLNKKLELIRLNPENAEQIINMDNQYVMQKIMDEKDNQEDGAVTLYPHPGQDDENNEDDEAQEIFDKVPPFLRSTDQNNIGGSDNMEKLNQLGPGSSLENSQTPSKSNQN